MILHNRLGFVAYEVPGGTAGGGAPTPPAPQPGAPGQGSEGQGDAFRQQYFSNVPDEQWALIEPHLQNVNRHVTQTEQRFAPLKNYTPEAVQGLAQFAETFERDPRGQWLQLGTVLQQRGIIDADVDLEYLAAIAAGEDPADDGGGMPNGNEMPPVDQMPPWAQQLARQVEELSGGFNQFQQTTQQARENAALTRQMGWMKSQLSESGIPEELLTDQRLMSSFIAHGGNAQLAVKDLQDMRTGLLKGVASPSQPRPAQQKLDLPNGAPPSPPRSSGSPRRGMFNKETSTAAEQFVRRAAQEG
jgi:hypothetical protein